jgi:hypothetical protein
MVFSQCLTYNGGGGSTTRLSVKRFDSTHVVFLVGIHGFTELFIAS